MDEGTRHPVIDLMEEQKGITEKGGTMRLGAWDCNIKEGSRVHKAYNPQIHYIPFNKYFPDNVPYEWLHAISFWSQNCLNTTTVLYRFALRIPR